MQSIRKRDGSTVPFDVAKITAAIRGAWLEVHDVVGVIRDESRVDRVALDVTSALGSADTDVESVQDAIEVALMRAGEFAVARAFIVFRDERTKSRSERTVDPDAISSYIHAAKYARHRSDLLRRELRSETVDRVEEMHLKRFAGAVLFGAPLEREIRRAFDFVREKKVLPSMRSMQFGGPAVEASHARQYNCLGVETEFITEHGVRRFSDFKDGDSVRVLTHTGRWRDAVVHSYGEQRLFNVRVARGRSSHVVRATRDHQWVLLDGTRTHQVGIKQKLAVPPRIVGDWVYAQSNPEERWYWAMGYVYGDGTCLKDEHGQYTRSMVRLCGDDGRFLERFQELGFATSSPPSCNGESIAYTGRYLKTLPTLAQDGVANVTAFVRGFLDADGHKNSNGEPSVFKGIQVTGHESVDFVRQVFPAVGAYLISERDLTGEVTNFGTRPHTIDFGLVLGLSAHASSPYAVQEITEDVTETVWCLDVEEDHSFVLPTGIVTGNCCYTLVDRLRVFAETMYLLLAGCGTGYSVQFQHVERLPEVASQTGDVVHHVVGDDIRGWADAVDALVTHTFAGRWVEFAYHGVRDRGVPLKTSGGRAPGHVPLRRALESVRAILLGAQGRQLLPLECHEIQCHLADAVLSGGIRRSAMNVLFSVDDGEMMNCKARSDWYSKKPHLARANNSVVLLRSTVQEEQFRRVFRHTRQFGEPGFALVSNRNHGYNPCFEIGLDPVWIDGGRASTGWAFCNLTTINAAMLRTTEDFTRAARAATLIGTLQAAYTDFPYLGEVSEKIARRDALIGVSITGMQDRPEIALHPATQRAVAEQVVEWNEQFAAAIGIRSAARTTCVKPEGTGTLTLFCPATPSVGAGVHPHEARRYIRRVTADDQETVFQAFRARNPTACERKPDGNWVIAFPIQVADDATLIDDQTAVEFLEQVRSTQQNWVLPGTARESASPGLRHNVSCTVATRDHEWEAVADYLWTHRDDFTAVSFLPRDVSKLYAFAPYEGVRSEAQDRRWRALVDAYVPVDYSAIVELEDDTALSGEAACAGGACLI